MTRTDLSENCALTVEDFGKVEGFTVYNAGDKDNHYAFYESPTPAKVLGVAHMDSVVGTPYVSEIIDHPAGRIFLMPTADDRLGVYTITRVLPAMGCNIDILLTDNEEKGGTTAKEFIDDHGKKYRGKYNWIFSFDRTGHDVALYDYYDMETVRLLAKYGMEGVHGAFSCIRVMEDLGVKGFNWGTAYHNYHSEWAYVKVDEYLENVGKFLIFFKEQEGNKLTHHKKKFEVHQYSHSPRTYDQPSLFPTSSPKEGGLARRGRSFLTPEFDSYMCDRCGRFYTDDEVEQELGDYLVGAGCPMCPLCGSVATSLYATT